MYDGGVPPYLKFGIIFDIFWYILLYFPASGVLPIDSSRREDQNPPGEIEIGDFRDF